MDSILKSKLELDNNDLWIQRCNKFIKSMSDHKTGSVVPFFLSKFFTYFDSNDNFKILLFK